MAHQHKIFNQEIQVNAGWLPGYSSEAMKGHGREIKSSLIDDQGAQYLGTKMGLYILENGNPKEVAELAGMDVKDMALTQNGVLVGTKQGIWTGRNNEWKKVLGEDVHSLATGRNGRIFAVVKENQLYVSSDDGNTWASQEEVRDVFSQMPKMETRQVPLGKLMGDLHTGKAFFGKKLEWIWIDLVSLTLILLCFTGVFLWRKNQKQKARLVSES